MQRKLEGRSLEIAKEMDKEHDAIHEFREKLHAESVARFKEYSDAANERVKKLTEELGAIENLDMDKYTVDGTYLDEHQLAFIVDAEEPSDHEAIMERIMAQVASASKGE